MCRYFGHITLMAQAIAQKWDLLSPPPHPSPPIIRAAMDDKVLFALIWRLAMRQHQLLHDVLPVAQEMANCLRAGAEPDPEDLSRWLATEEKVHRAAGHLSEQIAGIQQMVQKSPYGWEG